MLGFVFGLTGLRESRPFHWSHMLAITPAGRDLGLGTRLKLYQRECLLPLGIEEIQWTYDPLESRNAHLNFNHLGVGVAEYVEDMYAGEMGSELAEGIGSDRFIVSWRIASERVALALRDQRAGSDEPFRAAPVVNPEGVLGNLPEAPRVRIEIPENIQAVKTERPAAALAWRESTRAASRPTWPAAIASRRSTAIGRRGAATTGSNPSKRKIRRPLCCASNPSSCARSRSP